MTVTTDAFTEQVEKVESQFNLQWNFGMKQTFITDVKRELESVNGKFRIRGRGVAIDIQDYLTEKLKRGFYTKLKPGVKEKYAGPFKYRDEATKKQHSEFTKSFLLKALKHQGIIFNEGYEAKAVEIISQNFLPVDDEKKGFSFAKITDSDIGSLPGYERYNVEDLLNHLHMAGWVDDQASRISKAQHKAELRKLAISMLPTDSKSKEIERQVDELYAFEARSLRTGRNLPSYSKDLVDSEFRKFRELNGGPKSGPHTSVNKANSVDDVSELQASARNFKVDSSPKLHEGI